MNAVIRLATDMMAKAARSGRLRPMRSAAMVKTTPINEAARTAANTPLICPSVSSSDVRTNGSVCGIWLAAYPLTNPMMAVRNKILRAEGVMVCGLCVYGEDVISRSMMGGGVEGSGGRSTAFAPERR